MESLDWLAEFITGTGHISSTLKPNIYVQRAMLDSEFIILDIEGTTTSLQFVRTVLVPYFETRVMDYITAYWSEMEMQEVVKMLYEQSLKEEISSVDGFVPLPPLPQNASEIKLFQEALVVHIKWQIAKDLKSIGLKILQGFIWKEGYQSGEITGHVFEDAAAAMKKWKGEKKNISIYSSATAESQRLLLRHSVCGNLEPLVDNYFDTTNAGLKTNTDSYLRFLTVMGARSDRAIFFSDRPQEIAAAKAAGMYSVLVVRDLDNPYIQAETEFLGQESWRITTFQELIDLPPWNSRQ